MRQEVGRQQFGAVIACRVLDVPLRLEAGHQLVHALFQAVELLLQLRVLRRDGHWRCGDGSDGRQGRIGQGRSGWKARRHHLGADASQCVDGWRC